MYYKAMNKETLVAFGITDTLEKQKHKFNPDDFDVKKAFN